MEVFRKGQIFGFAVLLYKVGPKPASFKVSRVQIGSTAADHEDAAVDPIWTLLVLNERGFSDVTEMKPQNAVEKERKKILNSLLFIL